MKDPWPTAIGWIVGFLCFVGLFFVCFAISEVQWHQNIRRARQHRGWVIREGTTVQQSQPDFSSAPPSRQAKVRYRDYYERPVEVDLDLSYRSKVGDKVKIDAASNGSIYSPDAVDTTNQVRDDPLVAHPSFWPGGGIFLGVIASAVISFIVGLIAFSIADEIKPSSFKGRLGSR